MIIQHISDTKMGVAGAGTTVSSLFFAWLTGDALPVLNALSLIATTIAGIATAAYYITKWIQARRK